MICDSFATFCCCHRLHTKSTINETPKQKLSSNSSLIQAKMKWLSKEPFTFNDNEYSERARNMSAHALWMRQCKKYRTKVSSSTGIGFSSLMLIPTVGVSLLGVVANGRTLDIARRKRKVIDAEALRRNLPDYEETKRVAGTFLKIRRAHRKDLGKVKDCQLLFKLNLKEVLLPLLQDEVLDKIEYELLLLYPGGPAWKNEHVESASRAICKIIAI